jgi:hypothetical protein
LCFDQFKLAGRPAFGLWAAGYFIKKAFFAPGLAVWQVFGRFFLANKIFLKKSWTLINDNANV